MATGSSCPETSPTVIASRRPTATCWLHLTDIVLHHSPLDPAGLQVKRRALQQMLDDSGRDNFSEVQWLEHELEAIAADGET